MLYAIGERDVVLYFAADLAEQSDDVAALSALGELTARHDDALAMLQLGKTAGVNAVPGNLQISAGTPGG